MLLKDARYCQFIGYVRYVSALARTKVLFPAGTARRCRVEFRPPRAPCRSDALSSLPRIVASVLTLRYFHQSDTCRTKQ
jgi:hypothetical protein